jgi:ribulose-phosphate 3-epimerase
LTQDVQAAEAGGADWIHVDVMDGHFVPNITIGPMVAEAVRKATELPVDVHLMIEAPERYVDAFAAAGAHRITVHQETCPHLHRTLQQIRDAGASPGVALNPSTPVDTLRDVAVLVDMILVMTVNPGFGGQAFIPASPRKIRAARELLEEEGRGDCHVQVDGGVAPDTAKIVVEAGADVLVAGSAVFGHSRGAEGGIQALRKALSHQP